MFHDDEWFFNCLHMLPIRFLLDKRLIVFTLFLFLSHYGVLVNRHNEKLHYTNKKLNYNPNYSTACLVLGIINYYCVDYYNEYIFIRIIVVIFILSSIIIFLTFISTI